MQKPVPIFFGLMRDMGLKPPPLRGAFLRDQLILVEMDNCDGMITWKRQLEEHCADFETRVIEAIRDMMDAARKAAQ